MPIRSPGAGDPLGRASPMSADSRRFQLDSSVTATLLPFFPKTNCLTRLSIQGGSSESREMGVRVRQFGRDERDESHPHCTSPLVETQTRAQGDVPHFCVYILSYLRDFHDITQHE